MRDDIDEARLARLVNGLSRSIKSLDWREFHFFKEQGLSKTDHVAIRTCLDYELARESSRVRGIIQTLSQERRQQILEGARRHNSRYLAIRFSDEPSDPNFPKWADVQNSTQAESLPPVPAACVAASWFPAPWLCGPVDERRSIVKRLTPVYAMRPLTVFEYPLEKERANLLVLSAQTDGNTSLHVIAINREQTRASLLKAFNVWLDRQNDITGCTSRQGKNKFAAALSDLGCYRLMTNLDSQARSHAMNLSGFRRSNPKLSESKGHEAFEFGDNILRRLRISASRLGLLAPVGVAFVRHRVFELSERTHRCHSQRSATSFHLCASVRRERIPQRFKRHDAEPRMMDRRFPTVQTEPLPDASGPGPKATAPDDKA